MTFTVFEVSDADGGSSGKGENMPMTIRRWIAGGSFYRHQIFVCFGARTISFCLCTRRGRGCSLFNNYSPLAGFVWNEKLSFVLGAASVDSGSALINIPGLPPALLNERRTGDIYSERLLT
jgi:hypothetical protein